MATNLTQDELQRLARLGAERRLDELRREEAAILAAFPEIGRGGRGGRGRKSKRATDMAAAEPATTRVRRGRRRMSRAEKKAVSDRMKKYWAERRKAR